MSWDAIGLIKVLNSCLSFLLSVLLNFRFIETCVLSTKPWRKHLCTFARPDQLQILLHKATLDMYGFSRSEDQADVDYPEYLQNQLQGERREMHLVRIFFQHLQYADKDQLHVNSSGSPAPPNIECKLLRIEAGISREKRRLHTWKTTSECRKTGSRDYSYSEWNTTTKAKLTASDGETVFIWEQSDVTFKSLVKSQVLGETWICRNWWHTASHLSHTD